MKLTYREVSIGPEMAARWLETKNYEDNRSRSRARVELYARQMRLGNWALNGEALILDTSGMLLNGQHRLAAVILHGRPVTFSVIEGVEQSLFTTMDQAYSRTASAVLKMSGYDRAPRRAATCRALHNWTRSGGASPFAAQRVAPDEILSVQERFAPEVDHGVLYAQACKGNVPMGSGLLGLAHILLNRIENTEALERAQDFLEVLKEGLTTQGDHPALTLRRRIISDKMRGRVGTQHQYWAMLGRAWNAHTVGKGMKTASAKRTADGATVLPKLRFVPRPE